MGPPRLEENAHLLVIQQDESFDKHGAFWCWSSFWVRHRVGIGCIFSVSQILAVSIFRTKWLPYQYLQYMSTFECQVITNSVPARTTSVWNPWTSTGSHDKAGLSTSQKQDPQQKTAQSSSNKISTLSPRTFGVVEDAIRATASILKTWRC